MFSNIRLMAVRSVDGAEPPICLNCVMIIKTVHFLYVKYQDRLRECYMLHTQHIETSKSPLKIIH